MKLFYYKDPIGNFGDDLNIWLWSRLIPDILDGDDDTLFVGIGSILDSRIPHAPRKVVFGTGVGYGRLPAIDDRWSFCCVRGPLTADALGLPKELAVTDPAVLVQTVARVSSQAAPRGVSFLPHFRTPMHAAAQGIDLEAVCASAGMNYINPSGGVEHVLASIQGSELVIAEAMHGAIVADALGVPWIPVRIYSHILPLKWWDWCKSLRLEYNPSVFVPSLEPDTSGGSIAADLERFLQQVRRNCHRILSDRELLGAAISRLQDLLEQVRCGHLKGCFTGSAELEINPEMFRGVPWLHKMHLAIRDVASVVPVGASFVLVDDQQWGGGEVLGGRHTIRFLERDGHYWGLPPDDDTALRNLERLRGSGADYIVFAWNSFWWLDYYMGLNRYLRSSFPCIMENDRLTVFRLQTIG